AAATDLRVHLCTQLAPANEGRLQLVPFGFLDRAIDRNPRPHPRMREVTLRAAYLPYPVVRLFPIRRDEVDQHALEAPGVRVQVETGASREAQRIDHFHVDIDLCLPGRSVPRL